MKAYLTTSGAVFGLLTIAHIWRMFAEKPNVVVDPWYLLITAFAAALCLWAVRLLWRSPRP